MHRTSRGVTRSTDMNELLRGLKIDLEVRPGSVASKSTIQSPKGLIVLE